MPAGSKTDPLLAKAKPISNSGSASGVTELRREKKTKQKTERGVRICERNNSADTKVTKEEGAGGAPGTGAEIPLQPLKKTMVRQAVPLQPMEVTCGADIHLQPEEDPTLEQVEAPKGGCDPVGSPHWSRFLAGPVDPWREEPTLEQVYYRPPDQEEEVDEAFYRWLEVPS
ncbi:AN1-type zinc finger protein 5-like [Grus japonensis]|uniref:AN1-type zinc finger protein 5-like n=1 Tax=Grus japonensis TaxID=30415 RepID=A0ABC9WC90_GRUJA